MFEEQVTKASIFSLLFEIASLCGAIPNSWAVVFLKQLGCLGFFTKGNSWAVWAGINGLFYPNKPLRFILVRLASDQKLVPRFIDGQ